MPLQKFQYYLTKHNTIIQTPYKQQQQFRNYLTKHNTIIKTPCKMQPNTIRKRLLSFDQDTNNMNKINTLVNDLEKIMQDNNKQQSINTQIKGLEKIIQDAKDIRSELQKEPTLKEFLDEHLIFHDLKKYWFIGGPILFAFINTFVIMGLVGFVNIGINNPISLLIIMIYLIFY
jgi:hypothetical protein